MYFFIVVTEYYHSTYKFGTSSTMRQQGLKKISGARSITTDYPSPLSSGLLLRVDLRPVTVVADLGFGVEGGCGLGVGRRTVGSLHLQYHRAGFILGLWF